MSAKHVHLIGIGGIGISALARLLLREGKHISGTNDSESAQTLNALRGQGVVIGLGTDPLLLPVDADAFVYSLAWEKNAPTLMAEARNRGVPIFTYFEGLGDVSEAYQTIAISGTHGKTTTTAMTATVLSACGLSPRAIVGSIVPEWESNYLHGSSAIFVVEACEYQRSFTHLTPFVLAITNIEEDHLDYYKDLADIESAFREVAEKVPRDGAIVADMTIPSVARVVAGLSARIVDYKEFLSQVPLLKIPGEHNRKNAAVALATAHILGISGERAQRALESFQGTARRFEYKGETKNGAVVFDDYAHHPSEIRATLAGAQERFPNKRIVAVFQPHLFSRTEQLFAGFVDALSRADEVVVAPIYAAREKDPGTITSQMVVTGIHARNPNVSYVESRDLLAQKISSYKSDSVVVVMGAGDIGEVAHRAVQN